MKYCPVCQTRFDEEIVRFCTKDGAPLVEENPSFTAMPSESFRNEDDGEETVIRRNTPQQPSEIPAPSSSQRIVIPTNEIKEPVRAKAQAVNSPPPKKSNTAVIVLLTIIGTFVVLGGLGGIWYVLRGGSSNDANANKTNINSNSLPNASFNTNTLPVNLNTNLNTNVNTNINTNTNLKTPTPTPTRTPTTTPTPTPTPANTNVNVNSNTNVNIGNTNIANRPTPMPSATPPTSPNPPSNVNVGLMNSRATKLTTPAYPQSARQINASGEVRVQVSVDDQGNVTSAKAISGNPLLRPSAEAAARQSRFNPVRVGDRAVSATGYLVYNFINQ